MNGAGNFYVGFSFNNFLLFIIDLCHCPKQGGVYVDGRTVIENWKKINIKHQKCNYVIFYSREKFEKKLLFY